MAAAIMQGQAPGANPASLQAAATYFEQVTTQMRFSDWSPRDVHASQDLYMQHARLCR